MIWVIVLLLVFVAYRFGQWRERQQIKGLYTGDYVVLRGKRLYRLDRRGAIRRVGEIEK